MSDCKSRQKPTDRLWWLCFLCFDSIPFPVSPPPLCLKVTSRVSQSALMTLVLSEIHHVSCVSDRCCSHWAVGGLSGVLALYNMQIITCKLPASVCHNTSAWMQMQHAIWCVLDDLNGLQAFHQIQLNGHSLTWEHEGWRRMWLLLVYTFTQTDTGARSLKQPPAVLQQEVYCRQHSCNNKTGPLLQGNVLLV